MSRPKLRSDTLSHDTIAQIKHLFGTIKNAHDLLGLQVDVAYNVFYMAMQFKPITPAQREVIELRWANWRKYYLNPACPSNDDLRLHPMDVNMEPEWYEERKETPDPIKDQPRSTRSGKPSSGSSSRPSARSAT